MKREWSDLYPQDPAYAKVRLRTLVVGLLVFVFMAIVTLVVPAGIFLLCLAIIIEGNLGLIASYLVFGVALFFAFWGWYAWHDYLMSR